MSDPNGPTPPYDGSAPHPPRPPVPPVPPSILNHPLRPNLAPPDAVRAPSPYEPVRPEDLPPPSAYPDPYQGGYYQRPHAEPYAHWGRRVGALLLDTVVLIPFYIPTIIGGVIIGNHAVTDPITNQTTIDSGAAAGFAIAAVGYLAGAIFSIWNQIFRQGRRGASLGKQWMQIVVVSETDGRPIGAGMTFVRSIVHLLDGLSCYIGYLWPLWDEKRQTFADKIMHTAVLYLPSGPAAPAYAPAPYQPPPAY